MGLSGISSSALSGLNRQFDALDRAATKVASLSVDAGGAASVDISGQARSAGSDSADSNLVGAMVDTRIAKYLAVANMKVLQTSNELSDTLESIVR